MNTDEGQMNAAVIIRDAAENNLRAANIFADAVRELTMLIGSGYGNNVEQIIELLRQKLPTP